MSCEAEEIFRRQESKAAPGYELQEQISEESAAQVGKVSDGLSHRVRRRERSINREQDEPEDEVFCLDEERDREQHDLRVAVQDAERDEDARRFHPRRPPSRSGRCPRSPVKETATVQMAAPITQKK